MKRILLAAMVLALGLGCVAPATSSRGRAALEVVKVDKGRFHPVPGEPVFVLVMGSDARPGETRSRGDALHVIGINPAEGKATILNIPRDTWTNIPGRGPTRSTRPTTTAARCYRLGLSLRWSGSTSRWC